MNIICKYDALVSVDDLKPFDKNRNRHSAEQIERLAYLLKHHGVRAPIIVAKAPYNCIAKGHGTLEAIRRNGWKTAPVVYQDFENYDMLYAFVQSDNAIADWAELDLAAINLDLPELGPFDIELLGIRDFEVTPPGDEHEGDPDDVPEPPKVARTKRGELWLLDPYYVCESCKKQYPYDVGKAMSECACG